MIKMLWTCNNTVTIKRMVESVGEKTYSSTIKTGEAVYIEPLADDVLFAMDGQGAFKGYKLFTTYQDVLEGDKIIDKNNVEYKIRGVKKYDSIIGKHIEAIIQAIYD